MSEQSSLTAATVSRVLRTAGVVALLLTAVSFLAYTLTRSPSAIGATLVLLLVGIVLVVASRVVHARGRAERQPGGASRIQPEVP